MAHHSSKRIIDDDDDGAKPPLLSSTPHCYHPQQQCSIIQQPENIFAAKINDHLEPEAPSSNGNCGMAADNESVRRNQRHASKVMLRKLCLVFFLWCVGFLIIFPVLPQLLIAVVPGEDDDHKKRAAARLQGLMQGIEKVIQFFVNPLWGALSDRIGRKPVLMLSHVLAIISIVLLSFWNTVPGFWSFFILGGLCDGCASTIYAAIVDLNADEKNEASLTRKYGVLFAVFGVAVALGPAAGGLMSLYSTWLPLHVSACCLLLGLLLTINTGEPSLHMVYGADANMPGTKNRDIKRMNWSDVNPVPKILQTFKMERFRVLSVSIILNYLSDGVIQMFVIYTAARYNWTIMQVGIFLSFAGLSIGMMQGSVRFVIPHRLTELNALRVGYAFTCAANVGYGMASDGWMLYISIPLMAIGSINIPVVQGIVSGGVESTETQGVLQGSLRSLTTVVAAVSYPIYGLALSALLAGTTDHESLTAHPAAYLRQGGLFFFVACINVLNLLYTHFVIAPRHAEWESREGNISSLSTTCKPPCVAADEFISK